MEGPTPRESLYEKFTDEQEKQGTRLLVGYEHEHA